MSKDNKKTITKRILGKSRRGLIIVLLVVIIGIALVSAFGIMEIMESRTHASAEKLVSQVVDHIDEKLNAVEDVTRIAAQDASQKLDSPVVLEKLVQDFVEENSFVYGSTIAFEPYAFPILGRCYAPYSWKGSDGVVHSRQLGTETDYYEEEWYSETKKSRSEYWCEPYYDEGGAKIMMCTFSVPLFDADGKLVAIMTADVGLADLEEYISSINPSSETSILLLSKMGNTLVDEHQGSEAGSNSIIIKGKTEIGWSVELMMPFTYLMRGDSGLIFFVGIILLLAILLVFFFNRVFENIQKRSSDEYLQVIDSISISYSSIYLIDLKTGGTYVIRDPENYAEMISSFDEGADTDFTTKFARLIEYDTYLQDREKMHREIQTDSIRDNLKSQDRYEVRFRKAAGDDISWYEMRVFIMDRDASGNPVRAVVAFTDVDESVQKEKENQEALEQALAMAQSANRAKTTFLNNMSHDIRTPMNAIIGYTGLAASHIDSKELVQDYLGKIGQSSDHLLSLINDILDMSRIESGKMNLDEREENLSEIVHTLKNIVQADIHSKGIDFYIDALDVNDVNVICDKLRLNQVLLNILSNAIKYTPSGGTVSMRIVETSVSENGYGTYEIHIKDNGIGMSEDFLKTVFDPFTRVNSSTVSGIQGTGLGMAITKNIVDMMGGDIAISSREGEGTEVVTSFRFKLAANHEEPKIIVELEGLRSLVVDDDHNTCISVQRMLKAVGMRADWCTSGREAVFRTEAALQDGEMYRVYIIDWLMPDLNGIETARRIRHIVGDDAPIIILTANDWSDIEDDAKEAGVTAFVSKPLFPSGLHRILEKCIGKEAPAEPEKEYDFSGKRVLLVEDNEMNREIAEEILSEAGFVVDTAGDGTVAVEKMQTAKAGDYDLVLMDIQMPLMDGYEATRQIRAMGTEISRIPILAMTANAFEEDRQAALDAGMNEHIAKPIDVNKLKETLSRFLEQ